MDASPGTGGSIEVDGAPSALPAEYFHASQTDHVLEAIPARGYRFSFWSGDITGSQNPVVYTAGGGARFVTANFVRADQARSEQDAERIHFPLVISGNGWETEAGIINTSSGSVVKGAFKAYSESGRIVVQSGEIELSPHARRTLVVGMDFPLDAVNIKYMAFEILEGRASDLSGYTEIVQRNANRVAFPALRQVISGDVYAPFIPEDQHMRTHFHLVNTTSSPKTLSVTFNSSSRHSLTLAGGEQRTVAIGDFFGSASIPVVTSAMFGNAEGIIGVVLYGDDSRLDGYLLTREMSQDYYFPHIADNNRWRTGMIAYNPWIFLAALTFRAYNADGDAISERRIGVEEWASSYDTAASLGLPAETAWVHVSSPHPVLGMGQFVNRSGAQVAGHAAFHSARTAGVFPKIDPDGWTGIALINIENTSATVLFQAYDDRGRVIAAEQIRLDRREKAAFLLEGLFRNDIGAATYIAFTSQTPVIGLQLTGSPDGRMLDALPGM